MTTRTDASDLREHGHELLDAGYGRRLERFGALVVDRPAPSVEGIAPGDPAAWRSAAARYDEGVGRTAWSATSGTSTTWEVT
ncbi:MAG TPA: hypothetical protein VIV06_00955, partial [Candidatus Limnocylindrales bacterium]